MDYDLKVNYLVRSLFTMHIFVAISVGYIILVAMQMIIFYINLCFLLMFNLNRFIRWKTCFESSCGENRVVL